MSILNLNGLLEPRRIYAIGDIHGRLDLLERMADLIERDVAKYGSEGVTVVALGDYVDRGPESRGVLEFLSGQPFSVPFVGLAGNHEQMLLGFLANPKAGSSWCRQGGIETLRSYAVPVHQVITGRGYTIAAETLNWLLPDEHRRFLKTLKLGVLTSEYFLCHAGIRPGVVWSQQKPSDLLWIRDEFLNSTANFGRIVVHGHTIVSKVDVRANRINVDTGAFESGRLSCLVLEGGEAYVLTATN